MEKLLENDILLFLACFKCLVSGAKIVFSPKKDEHESTFCFFGYCTNRDSSEIKCCVSPSLNLTLNPESKHEKKMG